MKQFVDNGLRPAPAGQDGVGGPHTERALSARLRGLLALMVCLCLTLALLPAPARAAEMPTDSWTDERNYNTGWYTDGPTSFTISTAADLAGLAKLVNDGTDSFSGKTITLTADLDLSEHLWPGIGKTEATAFQGTFDGAKHSISNMTQSGMTYGGFFGCINNAKVTKIHIKKANIGIHLSPSKCYGGSVVGKATGSTISDCIAEATKIWAEDGPDGTDSKSYRYMGGLVGDGNSTFSNCGVIGLDIYNNEKFLIMGSSGGLGQGTFENCVVTTARIDVIQGQFAVNHNAYKAGVTANISYCYFGSIDKCESNSLRLNSSGTAVECMDVTEAQIAGTSTDEIGGSSTYAKTASLTEALNNWVSAHSGQGYNRWILENGIPTFFVPNYIDISGPLDEVTHQSATGDIETGMELEGQIQENVTLLSVTMPASIPFIVDVDGKGAFKRVLSATGTLTNRSDCPVDITLTAVTDDGGLLNKVALALIPDPAPKDATQIALTAGTGKSDLLAALDAPAAGASTATLKVDGADKLGGAFIGSDGDAFVVGLTLKVSKQ